MNDETHFKFILSVQTKNRCSTYLSQVLAHQRTIHLRPFSPQFTFRETKHCNANQHTHTINAGCAKVENARSKANLVFVAARKMPNYQIPNPKHRLAIDSKTSVERFTPFHQHANFLPVFGGCPICDNESIENSVDSSHLSSMEYFAGEIC